MVWGELSRLGSEVEIGARSRSRGGDGRAGVARGAAIGGRVIFGAWRDWTAVSRGWRRAPVRYRVVSQRVQRSVMEFAGCTPIDAVGRRRPRGMVEGASGCGGLARQRHRPSSSTRRSRHHRARLDSPSLAPAAYIPSGRGCDSGLGAAAACCLLLAARRHKHPLATASRACRRRRPRPRDPPALGIAAP